ncbi:MAG: addiction module protein [Schlesneria sp.]
MLESETLPKRDYVLQQAMSLDFEDRVFVMGALEESLKGVDFETPEIAFAWATEIERRAEAYEQGSMSAEDWREVMARLRGSDVSTQRTHS